MKRKMKFSALLLLTTVLLCGCGEEKKADTYLKEGNYKEAVQLYEGLLLEKDTESAREKNQSLYCRMGEAYCFMESYQEGLDCFNQVTELAGEGTVEKEVYLYRGLCYEKLSDYQAAAADYETYFELASGTGESLSEKEKEVQVFAWNELGLCYMKQEAYDKALDAISSGLSLEPEEGKKQSLIRNKVVVLEYLAQFEEAYRVCEEYLEEYPQDEEMLREYEFLETRIEGK